MLALKRVVGKGRPFGVLTDPGSFWGWGRREREEEGKVRGEECVMNSLTIAACCVWVRVHVCQWYS